ncbi:MAG: dihydroorotate dehydrogenase-like protein [Bacteroidota bacterium]
MANLETTYMGLKLKSPIIAGSCGLTNSIENIKELAAKGAGAIVIKSMFEEQILIETEKYIKTEDKGMDLYTKTPASFLDRRVHDYEEAYSYIYEYAKKNTLNTYLDFIREAKKSVDIPIISSINCTSAYDWQSYAKNIEDAGADALEFNLYVLPSDFNSTVEENEKVYYDVIDKVKNFVKIPYSIKLGYYFSALAPSIIKLSESGVKGLVLFNRPYNPDIDIENICLSDGNIYSSDLEYARSLRWISILSGKVKCDLVANTGIHNYETVIKQLLAGAQAVEIVSAIYNDGFEVIEKISNDIKSWMQRHNFEKIEDFRGKLCKSNLEHPAAIERVQFMKLYSGIE